MEFLQSHGGWSNSHWFGHSYHEWEWKSHRPSADGISTILQGWSNFCKDHWCHILVRKSSLVVIHSTPLDHLGILNPGLHSIGFTFYIPTASTALLGVFSLGGAHLLIPQPSADRAFDWWDLHNSKTYGRTLLRSPARKGGGHKTKVQFWVDVHYWFSLQCGIDFLRGIDSTLCKYSLLMTIWLKSSTKDTKVYFRTRSLWQISFLYPLFPLVKCSVDRGSGLIAGLTCSIHPLCS